MGLGSTARKIQTLTDTAEELYHKLQEVLERVRGIQTSIEDSAEQLDSIDARLDRQEALIEAIAEANGIDTAEFEVAEAESADEEATEGDTTEETAEDEPSQEEAA